MKPVGQLIDDIREAIEVLGTSGDPQAEEAISDLARLLYNPDDRLQGWAEELENFNAKTTPPSKKERKRAGELLEGIALACFSGIKGVGSLKSFRAPDAQHDLLISGNSGNWIAFCDYCRIDRTKRGVLVEAKAVRKPVSSSQFSRVCSNINHTTLTGLVSLGIIFSLRGASGFPGRSSRATSLKDARLRQATFYLLAKIPVVVFDIDDTKQLSVPGKLPEIVERKVRELFDQSGQMFPRVTNGSPSEIDVPEYLNEFRTTSC